MTTQYDVQQVISQAMVSVMTVSVMSVAIGIAIAAMGPEALTLPPSERKGTAKALTDLKITFGADLVSKAAKDVGTDDIITLCKEIERVYIERMEEKYGKYATKVALSTAIPGDLSSANEIALALSRRGYGKFAAPANAPAPITVLAAATREGTTKAKKKAKPTKDIKTGIVYRSKAAAGMAVAAEYGLDPTETFIYYEIMKRDPGRLVPATREEYEKYIKSI